MHHHGIIAISYFAFMAFIASSCSVGANMAFRADHSASMALSVAVPQAVEAKLRQFTTTASPASMFDAAAISASLSDRGLSVSESVSPDTRSWRGVFTSVDLEQLLARDEDLASVLSFNKAPGWASIRLNVDRATAPALVRLFPGLDGQLLEALQPPAVYDNPVNTSEYRTMLSGLLGRTAVNALEGARVMLTVSFPGVIIESSGSVGVDAAGKTASLAIPALDVMVLEQPVVFYVKWKD